jgi:hypothetical protein
VKVAIESYSDGRVTIRCAENLCTTAEDGIEKDCDIEVAVTADNLIAAIPIVISRFAEMQQACIDGLRTLGVKINLEHAEKELSS